jgi:PAS domain S-box-containing protein
MLIFTIFSIILLITGLDNEGSSGKIQDALMMCNIVFWIMSVISCYIYFAVYKKRDIFFIGQVYILSGFESVHMNNGNFEIDGNSSLLFLFMFYLFSTIMIYFILNNNCKFAKRLVEHKIIITIVMIIIFFISAIIDKVMYTHDIEVISNKWLIFMSIIYIIFNLYLTVVLVKKAIKKNEVIYIILVASLNILNIKAIYHTVDTYILNKNISDILCIFTFLGFIVFIFGLFIEVYFKLIEKNKIGEQRKLSEYKLENITKNILDMICTIDSKGRITYLNKASLEVLECTLEDAIGESYKKFMVNDHLNVNNVLSGDISRGTLIKHKISFKGNNEIEVESLIRRLLNDNGEIEGYIVVSRNTKMRRELESLTEKYNEIKEYNKIRTEFFANLSHEVRTPINIIFSCLQLLNKKREDGKDELLECYNKYEKTINQNCFRILRLINNIIDVTKIDSGYLNMNFINYDIILLVESIVMSVVPYVNTKSINIMFDTNLEENIIKCDPEQIERVMLNLIANSVKFTEPNGEILVDVNIDEKWVNIRVKDTGIGIPIKMKDIIFERFIQTDKSLNRKSEGSGIGLALVKSIVESHKGMVSLEKSDEKGSVFLVQLPNIISNEVEVVSREIKIPEEDKINQMIGIEFSDIYE